MAKKKYYWLKLKEDYLTSPKIKKLRKIAGGDTLTIIYLKMQLLSIKNNGIIQYEKIEPTFIEELALKTDEEVENIKLLLSYLQAQNLIEYNEYCFLLLEASNNIGSETDSAERVRKFREKGTKALHCNGSVTLCNGSVTNCNGNVTLYKREELDIEKELDIEIEKERQCKPATLSDIKTIRSSNGWVKLSDTEYERLINDFEKEEVDSMINYVDESAQMTCNKNKWKDWNLTIRRAIRDKWGNKSNLQTKNNGIGNIFFDMLRKEGEK